MQTMQDLKGEEIQEYQKYLLNCNYQSTLGPSSI